MINIFNIKRAVKYGQLEFFVQKRSIYVNDCQSGDCIQVGTVHDGKNRAKWIFKSFDEDTGISNSSFCSKCGMPKAQVYDNYCGNCGSLMERDNDGEIH